MIGWPWCEIEVGVADARAPTSQLWSCSNRISTPLLKQHFVWRFDVNILSNKYENLLEINISLRIF